MSMNTDHPQGHDNGGIPPPALEGIVLGCADAHTEHPSEAPNGHAPHDGDGQTAGTEELKPILEALLFVSHEPVSLERLTAALGMVESGTPASGEGFFYILRAVNCTGGSWDEGGSGQAAPRGPSLALSPAACP